MRMTKLYVRFYKSFNYNYERKAAPNATRREWEDFEGRWFPHVTVELDPSITAIVGANESGKSHLLDAIEILASGDGIERGNFCRYSEFYSVAKNQMHSPEFGGEFEIISEAAGNALTDVLSRPLRLGDRFRLFRPGSGQPFILYGEGDTPTPVTPAVLAAVCGALPQVYRLDTGVALPDSIPISYLAGRAPTWLQQREQRASLWDLIFGGGITTPNQVTEHASEILSIINGGDADPNSATGKQRELGRKLLIDVCGIDQRAFDDLAGAMKEGHEGQVNGLIQRMNNEIARNLNLARWWTQDREFKLLLSPREHELCFTIRDRTDTDYSFQERSRGLQYFLSYYVQLLAHQRPTDRHEILLMDEPDAYLSSSGQQDLLRILEQYAQPEDGSRRDQVVYVTHSPFLINRNAAHRIRVIEKGREDEGTRVVRDATKNHYEPLRTSLGSFVAETAFIGGSNLFVEGLADQVLLAGMSSLLRGDGGSFLRTLDLNEVTIVPAGSASSIPYLVYLARGRDQVRPPCAVLLDGDAAGIDAQKTLRRGGARQKPVIDDKFVIRVDTWAADAALTIPANVTVEEAEDLVPPAVAVEAARAYARRFLDLSANDADKLQESDLIAALGTSGSLWDSLAEAFTACFDGHIDKVGFAKEVITWAHAAQASTPRPSALEHLRANFAALIAHVALMLRAAAEQEAASRRDNRLRRLVNGFLQDHPTGLRREQALQLLEDITFALDDSGASDQPRLVVAQLRRDHKLDSDPMEQVPDFEKFTDGVKSIPYQQRLHDQHEGATVS
ncbi:AAA family ATPase [Micromonospora humi]|uniref:AAA ATPase domain-containing protein n=1 Tax=Micromonospora humi TaxID=745366 RepID=A0A1C5IR12_9ACTN|nr:AAA family ATPase [Micromonospora humi]SCG60429.1 AAA ATPase domain-containing protein [Micromonospora humi]